MSEGFRGEGGEPFSPAKQVGLPYPAFDGSPPSEPEDITGAFIADYKVWNDFAYASSEAGEGFEPAELSYDALIAKYCRPGKQRQCLAFGSHSSHSPQTSEVVAVKGRGERRTVIVRERRAPYYQPIYEFRFVRENERWFLDELFFVDEDDQNRRLRLL